MSTKVETSSSENVGEPPGQSEWKRNNSSLSVNGTADTTRRKISPTIGKWVACDWKVIDCANGENISGKSTSQLNEDNYRPHQWKIYPSNCCLYKYLVVIGSHSSNLARTKLLRYLNTNHNAMCDHWTYEYYTRKMDSSKQEESILSTHHASRWNLSKRH